MVDSVDILHESVDEVEKLILFLKKSKTKQVRADEERQIIIATFYSWKNNHRLQFSSCSQNKSLDIIDSYYATLFEYSAKHTTRSKYSQTLSDLKKALINFRSELFLNPEIVREVDALDSPDFSILISNREMQEILERRWTEIVVCLQTNAAPLSSIVMMGGLLEALFVTRVNMVADKKTIFKLKSVPKKHGKKKLLTEWMLNDYINVSTELEWISNPAKDVSIVFRDYRNLIHPARELGTGIALTSNDAEMLFPIFTQLALQIIQSTEKGDPTS